MFAKLKENFANQKYKQVIMEGEKLSNKVGYDEELYSLLAQSYVKKKGFRDANKYASEILRNNENHALSYSIVAAYLIDSKDFKEASTYLDRALSINPKLKNALYNYGIVFYNKGNLENAESKARQLLSYHKNFGLGYLLMGFILHRKRKFKEAREYYKKAKKCDKKINTFPYIAVTYLHLTRK